MSEVTSSDGDPLIRGVYRTSWGNRWFAQIRSQGKRYYLGTYESREEAAKAVLEARQELAES
jgi:hypothetical protein